MANTPSFTRNIDLASAEATAALARRLADRLGAGDVLLLQGGIGAGKTHFARALIQHLLPSPEDVPSPTFTLVQVYDTPRGEIWHSDLYRLSDPDEAVELGLEQAFDSAICLVEWPDRLADLTPQDALWLEFELRGEAARHLRLSWQDDKWTSRLQGLAG